MRLLIIAFSITLLIHLKIESKSNDNTNGCIYYLVEISNQNNNILELLLKNGFDTESIKFHSEDSFELITNSYEIQILDSLKINYKILIKDYESHIENQLKSNFQNKKYIFEGDFLLGSMAGFYTYQETSSFFNNLIKKYPDYFVKIDTIGYSIEKRPIICYSFSSHTKNIKKEVLYTALHHSREPSGLMVICYFIQSLLKKAEDGNQQAISILNKNLIHIIPIVNPDGYLYNQKIKPEGGGLWRKNRRLNQDSSYGVDLNRNYGDFDFWNSSNMGSSANPTNETYRGTQPFSEPETQALRDFCINHKINIAFNYHSYGDYFIYPYSALMSETPDSAIFRAFTMWVSKNGEITFGRDYNTVGYYGRGTSDDWMYKPIPEKPKIIAYTIEVGKHRDGFWPQDPETIYNQCLEYFKINYEMLLSTEANIKPVEISSDFDFQKNTSILKLNIQNIGIEELKTNCDLSISTLNNYIKLQDTLRTLNFLKPGDVKSLYFEIPFPKFGFQNGCLVPFIIRIETNNIITYDTLYTHLWYPKDIVLYQNGEIDSRWDSGKWGLEYDYLSNSFVLTDSPQSLYPDSITNFLTWTEPIELNYKNAYLEFDTRWQIESRYDFGIIQISTDNGSNWNDLMSDRMILGSKLEKSRQKENDYGFAGYFPTWVHQSIPLDKYLGQKVFFRFGLLSDPAKHFDGWFLKNISLKVYEELDWTSVEERKDSYLIHPNIISKRLTNFINLNIIKQNYNLVRITNILGKIILEKYIDNSQQYLIDCNLDSGIYFIELISKENVSRDIFIITE